MLAQPMPRQAGSGSPAVVLKRTAQAFDQAVYLRRREEKCRNNAWLQFQQPGEHRRMKDVLVSAEDYDSLH